jgi:hypothetical protein
MKETKSQKHLLKCVSMSLIKSLTKLCVMILQYELQHSNARV